MKSVALIFFVAATALAQAPAKPWESSLGAGLALTSGNTDTQNLNLSYATKYDPKTRVVFKADALYLRASADGEKQVDKATANARFENSISDRTFAFAEVSYLRDPFKDLSYFIAPVVGAGYRIIKSDAQNLTVDGAVGVVTQSGPLAGRSSSGAIKAGENYDRALTATSKVTQKLTGIWKTRDFGDSLYHFDVGLATTIATRLELKLAYNYDYKTRVAADVEKGDSALFAALLFKF
jgi:putative salt-induced outer membrane protein YdiY